MMSFTPVNDIVIPPKEFKFIVPESLVYKIYKVHSPYDTFQQSPAMSSRTKFRKILYRSRWTL